MKFERDGIAARFVGLPAAAPDEPSSVITVECDFEPVVDSDYVRKYRPRDGV